MQAPIRRIAIAACALLFAARALGHAMLDHAVPAVGSTVRASPVKVELWFSENLEPVFSKVKVLDSAGRQVDKGDKAVDRGDGAHLVVSLPPLAPGTYRVAWRAVSADSHATEGDFTFRVAP
ncbi:MAG: copper homeostasis periplasmic binding protein CopC [Caldimonas sp.]